MSNMLNLHGLSDGANPVLHLAAKGFLFEIINLRTMR